MHKYNFCLGFAWMDDWVYLIQKKRGWQKGLLNGLGGKLKYRETPLQAMVREFYEEAGVHHGDWREYCQMTGDNFIVHCFVAHIWEEPIHECEEGPIWKCEFDLLEDHEIIPNLRWLVPMSRDPRVVMATVVDKNPLTGEEEPAIIDP